MSAGGRDPAGVSYEVVVPTAGRPCLGALLAALAAGEGLLPDRVILVDDRRDREGPLVAPRNLGPLVGRVHVLAGGGRGPAAARNLGWRAARAEWVAFLDDDVIPPPGWRAALAADLRAAGPDVAGSQGRVRVPLPHDRRPTDWERNVAGLEHARWATADIAYRREALAVVGGFDERFPRAYREDADLGLRLTTAGRRIELGRRTVLHPVGEAGRGVSLTKQAGNADDALMRAIHGRNWRGRAGIPAGRRPRHLATTFAGTLALAAAAAGILRRPLVLRAAGRAPSRRPRQGHLRRAAASGPSRLLRGRRLSAGVAAAAGATWAVGTAELAWARIAPGPRTRDEILTMAWTSAAMPFAATAWWLRGLATRGREGGPVPRPHAVLFDRDGTLIVDVPYNGDPRRVEPVPGAKRTLERLRAAGIATGVVSNQSGIARGLLSVADVEAVSARMVELLGPVGPVAYCPHAPGDGCSCRKPAPDLILRVAAVLGVEPARCAVIGDIGADVAAAAAAGARGVLVPTPRTRGEEIAAAPEVAPDLESAVALLLDEPEEPAPVPLIGPREAHRRMPRDRTAQVTA